MRLRPKGMPPKILRRSPPLPVLPSTLLRERWRRVSLSFFFSSLLWLSLLSLSFSWDRDGETAPSFAELDVESCERPQMRRRTLLPLAGTASLWTVSLVR